MRVIRLVLRKRRLYGTLLWNEMNDITNPNTFLQIPLAAVASSQSTSISRPLITQTRNYSSKDKRSNKTSKNINGNVRNDLERKLEAMSELEDNFHQHFLLPPTLAKSPSKLDSTQLQAVLSDEYLHILKNKNVTSLQTLLSMCNDLVSGYASIRINNVEQSRNNKLSDPIELSKRAEVWYDLLVEIEKSLENRKLEEKSFLSSLVKAIFSTSSSENEENEEKTKENSEKLLVALLHSYFHNIMRVNSNHNADVKLISAFEQLQKKSLRYNLRSQFNIEMLSLYSKVASPRIALESRKFFAPNHALTSKLLMKIQTNAIPFNHSEDLANIMDYIQDLYQQLPRAAYDEEAKLILLTAYDAIMNESTTLNDIIISRVTRLRIKHYDGSHALLLRIYSRGHPSYNIKKCIGLLPILNYDVESCNIVLKMIKYGMRKRPANTVEKNNEEFLLEASQTIFQNVVNPNYDTFKYLLMILLRCSDPLQTLPLAEMAVSKYEALYSMNQIETPPDSFIYKLLMRHYWRVVAFQKEFSFIFHAKYLLDKQMNTQLSDSSCNNQIMLYFLFFEMCHNLSGESLQERMQVWDLAKEVYLDVTKNHFHLLQDPNNNPSRFFYTFLNLIGKLNIVPQERLKYSRLCMVDVIKYLNEDTYNDHIMKNLKFANFLVYREFKDPVTLSEDDTSKTLSNS